MTTERRSLMLLQRFLNEFARINRLPDSINNSGPSRANAFGRSYEWQRDVAAWLRRFYLVRIYMTVVHLVVFGGIGIVLTSLMFRSEIAPSDVFVQVAASFVLGVPFCVFMFQLTAAVLALPLAFASNRFFKSDVWRVRAISTHTWARNIQLKASASVYLLSLLWFIYPFKK